MKERPLTEFTNVNGEKVGQEELRKERKEVKGPWGLPEGWKWVKLGDLGKFEYGYTASATNEDTGVKFLRITDIDETGKIKWDQVPFCKISYRDFQKYVLRKGDLLFARIGATTGKATCIPDDIDAVFASYLIRLKITREDVLPKFVFYFTQTIYYWENIKKKRSDKLRKGINAKELARILIPLPPLEEQKRIVKKLDEIRSRVEEAKRLAREAKERVKELTASALHETFSKAEERGWKWVRIREIARDTERVNPTKYPEIEFWYIDIASIDNLTYRIVKPKKLKGKDAPSRARKLVKANDVIFATTRPYLKNVTIVPPKLDGQVCSTGFAVLRAIPEKTIPKWIFYYLISDRAIEKMIKPLMRGANYPAITDKDLFALKIPLPPLEEQKRIVAYLDAISERARQLIKLYEEREKELEKLWFSSLDEAFKGKFN